jgi:AraC-like DNA-binding protein
MGCKPRTLRARLAAEGGSFSDIVDTQRRELVLKLMAFPGVKLGAVAAQIGFSDPAAFTRAFRRWTGSTPKAWLRQSAATPTAWPVTVPTP